MFLCLSLWKQVNALKAKTMDTTKGLKTVMKFIHAYNNLNIEGMLRHVHKDISFKNIANGKTILSVQGIEDFRKQATQAAEHFQSRNQKILKACFDEEAIELTVDFFGLLARDLSDELKAGDTIQLIGRSVYRVRDNLIISITDYCD